MPPVVIGSTAHRHGVAEAAMLDAFYHPIAIHDLDDGLTMAVSGDHRGHPIEVGFVRSDAGAYVIVHAMKARSKYLP